MEVVFAHGSTFGARIIQAVTRSDKSHCALRYSPPNSAWMVHATIGGVQPDWWASFTRHYGSLARFQVLFDCADQALNAVVARLAHVDYDYRGMVGQGLALMFKQPRNPFSDRRAYRCTELIMAWHMECNRLNPGLAIDAGDPEMVTPGTLETYYWTRGDLFAAVP